MDRRAFIHGVAIASVLCWVLGLVITASAWAQQSVWGRGLVMKLYSHWRSSASYRVRIALNLKELTYKHVTLDLDKSHADQSIALSIGASTLRAWSHPSNSTTAPF